MPITIDTGTTTLTIEYSEPIRLSTLLHREHVPLDMPCGGRQRCFKCRVRATGALSPMTPEESALLSAEEQAQHIRFACMTTVCGDARVWLAAPEADGPVLTEGVLPPTALDPLGERYGIAVDIGTTTVAAYLYELQAGALRQTATARNPQGPYGADVVTRIEKAMHGDGPALAGAIRGCLTVLMKELCRREGIDLDAIDIAVLTGNTAMLYLLCGRDPASLAAAPFEPDTRFGRFVSPQDLSLPLPRARIYLPRCMAAYVGGDITTAVLAAGLAELPGPVLLVDIGTNGEMVLKASGRLLACSTAAGPAFEGAGIHKGMAAAPGAICRVWTEDGAFRYETIGGRAAVGLCGSGIVDALAVLLDQGIVDETGLFAEEGHPYTACLTEADGTTAFRFPGTDVVLTQKDIRAIQLAKAAICAGMRTLLQEAGVTEEALQSLLIAGGFGSVLPVPSAARIGLLPRALAEKTVAIGNAAGMGASLMLLNRSLLETGARLADEAETIELSTSAVFMDAYIEAMMFD